MTASRIGFTREQLRRGAVLGTIAHAVWVAKKPLLAAAQSWNGVNYLLDDSSGTIAAVTFGADDIFAAFFDAKSHRSPFTSGQPYHIDTYLKDIPERISRLARDEALEFMIQEYEGKDVPIITASFWSMDDDLVAVESWSELYENGGHVLRIQLMEDDRALAEWQAEFQLSAQRIDLVHSLFERKMMNPNTRITLTDAEKEVLSADRGEVESREVFASMNIDF